MCTGCVIGTALPSRLLTSTWIGTSVNRHRSFHYMETIMLLSMKLREGSPVLMSMTEKLEHGGIEVSCRLQSSLVYNYVKKGVSFFPPKTWCLIECSLFTAS